MKKYAGLQFQDTAVGYYRIIQPARFLKRGKLVTESRVLPWTGLNQIDRYYQWSDKTYMEICKDTDVIHTTLPWKVSELLKLLNLREHFQTKLVVDIDDNIYASSKDNPATENAAILQKNRETALRMADGITVSVPSLKRLYADLNPNIFVQPNGLDFRIWDRLAVPAHRGIRIGWRGAFGHKDDLELIRPVIEKLAQNHKFTFVCFGWTPKDWSVDIEHHPWVGFQKYPKYLAELKLDIAVIPLVDSGYNRCKSNIAWQEFSALKLPVVYSPTENHKGLPGMPVTNNYEWYEALETLIEDKGVRTKVGKGQYTFAKNNMAMENLIKPLAQWVDKLPRRTDLQPDLKPNL